MRLAWMAVLATSVGWACAGNRLSLLVALCAALGTHACFIGYDSRWGEAKRAQKNVAALSTPSTIAAAPQDNPRPDGGTRTLRVRIRPDPQFLSQTVDAPKQIADLVDDASRMLSATLAVEIEVDRVEPWSYAGDESPEVALATLQADDPGRDVDLVVGMVGALPKKTDSLHLLGVATLLGKHIVVRAAGRLGEHDAIDKAFYELSEDERARLLRLRKRHRALAILLHEIGHSLGALHERSAGSLMNPTYDPKMSGFGDASIALMHAAIHERDPRTVARAQLAILSDPTHVEWNTADRNAEMDRLQTLVGMPADAPAQRAEHTPRGGVPVIPAELQGEARERFAHAAESLRNGAVAAASETAKPLFSAYPNVYEVQDLRCQLATVRWLEPAELRAECAPFNKLLDGRDAGADRR